MNGNHLAAIESGMLPRVMLFRISEYSTSTAVWILFGRACIRPGDPHHREDRQPGRNKQVERRTVDAEHPEAHPVDDLNSFWIWNSLFLCWVKP